MATQLFAHFILQAPNMCTGYQTGTYSITIFSNNSADIVHDFGITEFQQHVEDEREVIAKELRTGLNVSEMYTVTVTVESIGQIHFREKNFCKLN